MKELPILMSTDMVRAILDGRKTMTRRIVKPQPQGNTKGVYADLYNKEPNHWAFWLPDNRMTESRIWKCPYGQPGDRLWVRETYHDGYAIGGCVGNDLDKTIDLVYKADDELAVDKWKPSIFMTRKYSRIMLEITNVKVELVQDISKDDCFAEGCPVEKYNPDTLPIDPWSWFQHDIWDKLYNKRGYGWNKNPWVWVIGFERLK